MGEAMRPIILSGCIFFHVDFIAYSYVLAKQEDESRRLQEKRRYVHTVLE